MTHFETLLQNPVGGKLAVATAKFALNDTKSALRFLVKKEITLKVPRTVLVELQSLMYELTG
jgi:uncharacterized protein YjbK